MVWFVVLFACDGPCSTRDISVSNVERSDNRVTFEVVELNGCHLKQVEVLRHACSDVSDDSDTADTDTSSEQASRSDDPLNARLESDDEHWTIDLNDDDSLTEGCVKASADKLTANASITIPSADPDPIALAFQGEPARTAVGGAVELTLIGPPGAVVEVSAASAWLQPDASTAPSDATSVTLVGTGEGVATLNFLGAPAGQHLIAAGTDTSSTTTVVSVVAAPVAEPNPLEVVAMETRTAVFSAGIGGQILTCEPVIINAELPLTVGHSDVMGTSTQVDVMAATVTIAVDASQLGAADVTPGAAAFVYCEDDLGQRTRLDIVVEADE